MENREIWKNIKGYPNYQVSNKGRIWNVKLQRYLTGGYDKDGYIRVKMTAINGKRKQESVHRLVAIAFLENPNHYPVVNHKDEVKDNNKVENLEWCTVGYNITYSKGKKVRCIELNKVYDSSQHAMRALKIDGSDIRKCCKEPKRTAGGYHWEYYHGKD